MKIRPKEFLIVSALFVILILVTIGTSSANDSNGPLYSTASSRENGVSLLYDTLKHMGYPVKTSTKPLNMEAGLNDVYLITQPYPEYLDYDGLSEMLQWVFQGGRLIYLETECPTSLDWLLEGRAGLSNGNFTLYRLGMGELLTGSCLGLLNQNLMNDRKTGRLIQATLDNWGYENVYFAEYYHGFRAQDQPSDNLWRHLPGSFKILLCQLFIIATLIIWRLGKRFGRPIPYFEELERDENEYLLTLSGVYQNAGLGRLILQFYYQHFIRRCAAYFKVSPEYAVQNIESLWHDNSMPNPRLLTDILDTMSLESINIKKPSARKQFMQAVANMQTLSSCVKLYHLQ